MAIIIAGQPVQTSGDYGLSTIFNDPPPRLCLAILKNTIVDDCIKCRCSRRITCVSEAVLYHLFGGKSGTAFRFTFTRIILAAKSPNVPLSGRIFSLSQIVIFACIIN